jgi:hypothetical protein
VPSGGGSSGSGSGSTSAGSGSTGGSGSTTSQELELGVEDEAIPVIVDSEVELVEEEPCAEEGYTRVKGKCISEEEYRVMLLEEALEQDPFLLIEDIPCEELQKWRDLANHDVPQSNISKLEAIDKNEFGDANLQHIKDASGKVVNMDFFPITVNTLPTNPNTNQPFTANGFLNYLRKNINDFVDTNESKFTPSNITGFDEQTLWLSNNPVDAIIHINIPVAGDGSVICSNYESDNWIFTTVEMPYNLFLQHYDGEHPVSGHRQFGFYINPNGSYTFYTRGVDRVTAAFDATVVENFKSEPFKAPDNLWNSFKEGIYEYVESHGGDAVAPSNEDNAIGRPDWDKAKGYIIGTLPLSELGCD